MASTFSSRLKELETDVAYEPDCFSRNYLEKLAKSKAKAGTAKFKNKDYSEAIKIYTAAFVMLMRGGLSNSRHAANLCHNIAAAHKRLGNKVGSDLFAKKEQSILTALSGKEPAAAKKLGPR